MMGDIKNLDDHVEEEMIEGMPNPMPYTHLAIVSSFSSEPL
jgi:hypothetical protein